ncbi:MAG: hypothetical protein LHW56_01520 [Candidatus Cloacimonetes bacterium]|nr:hypothetical protein [Candidatus Cloacimonadota bacterium]MDY0171566.1 hypothetical protein [Candidatus Cloacimonadaceae bacterium]
MKTPYLTGLHKVASCVKVAFSPFQVNNQGMKALHPGVGPGMSLALLTGFALATKIKQLRNSIRHKAILEDLIATDPIIKQAPREQVVEAYATIYHLAPRVALEKQLVREILQHVVKFGRMDMQTVKMLTDTEKTVKDIHSVSMPNFPKIF